jgi:hypothetical protein
MRVLFGLSKGCPCCLQPLRKKKKEKRKKKKG